VIQRPKRKIWCFPITLKPIPFRWRISTFLGTDHKNWLPNGNRRIKLVKRHNVFIAS
jgi:hypothetical protein